jgi:hypothetical protein
MTVVIKSLNYGGGDSSVLRIVWSTCIYSLRVVIHSVSSCRRIVVKCLRTCKCLSESLPESFVELRSAA